MVHSFGWFNFKTLPRLNVYALFPSDRILLAMVLSTPRPSFNSGSWQQRLRTVPLTIREFYWDSNSLLQTAIKCNRHTTGWLCVAACSCVHCSSTWTFISLSVSQILTTRTSPDVMRRPVSCSQSTTMPAPAQQHQHMDMVWRRDNNRAACCRQTHLDWHHILYFRQTGFQSH